ncbi:MAG: transposase [Candidatus Zambryskibacteria bacterium]|nr:transposase [Candidatus Zambryskibacteria bacterium]
MKNRDYKNFASGTIVHIYNRGNNREKIFNDEQDYKAFIFRIGLALGFEEKELFHELCRQPYSRIRITDTHKGDFKLYAFCLMPNHFHLLIEQCGDTPISKIISKICTSYAMYINKKYKRVGHVFQDCFKAVIIESNEQLMWVSAYIHMNAVKDGLVKQPSKYKWSSYNDYVSDRNLPIVHTDFLISLFENKSNFEIETLRFPSDEDMSRGVLDI